MVVEGSGGLAELLRRSDERGVGATEAEIASAENQFGARLPESYRAYIRQVGWLSAGPNEYLGIGPGTPSHLNLIQIVADERDRLGPGLPATLVPLRSDGGGNLYALDLSRGSLVDAPVVFFEHDALKADLRQVAPTLDDWFRQEARTLDEMGNS
jgi:cell wall assembly regulator SMI1